MGANTFLNIALFIVLPAFVGFAGNILWLKRLSYIALALCTTIAVALLHGSLAALASGIFFAVLPGLPPLLTLPIQFLARFRAERKYGPSGISIRPSFADAYRTFWE